MRSTHRLLDTVRAGREPSRYWTLIGRFLRECGVPEWTLSDAGKFPLRQP
jgi:hypothetical protein